VGVLPEPRVVGRALDGEVERDLEPVLGGAGDEPVEVVERAEGRLDGGVAALRAADRPRATRVARRGDERVVAPLAMRAPDGMHWREIDDVEAELRQPRQLRLDAAEAAPRARKELVPGAEAGTLAVDDELERWDRRLLRARQAGTGGGVEPLLHRQRLPSEERGALGQLAGEVSLACLDLPLELLPPGGGSVDPGGDRVPPAAGSAPPRAARRARRRTRPPTRAAPRRASA